MTSLRLTLGLLVLAGTVSFTGHAATVSASSTTETTNTAAKPALQVQVEAPFIFDLIRETDIVDALYWQIEQALTRKDKTLKLEQIHRTDEDASRPILTVTLLHWRTNRMGDVECRFTAEYRTADGMQSLGTFDGSTFAITRSRAFAGRDYENAAEEAGRQLRDALQKRGLI